MSEAIDSLIFNMGNPQNANSIVPPLERDELLNGLAIMAKELKERQQAGGTTNTGGQNQFPMVASPLPMRLKP